MDDSITYTMLVPEKLQAELIYLRDLLTITHWRIGEITKECIEYCNANRIRVQKEIVYSAVGSLVGKRSRRIREYLMVYNFYPVEVRADQRYVPLAFDHFLHARLLGTDYKKALDWCIEQADNHGGRPATVDTMIAKFGCDADGSNEPPSIVGETLSDKVENRETKRYDNERKDKTDGMENSAGDYKGISGYDSIRVSNAGMVDEITETKNRLFEIENILLSSLDDETHRRMVSLAINALMRILDLLFAEKNNSVLIVDKRQDVTVQ